MKVLWITNVLFPDVCEALGITPPVTGGWMKSMAAAMKLYVPQVELAVATLYGEGKSLYEQNINGVTYFCLPFDPYTIEYNVRLESVWAEVSERFKPDVIHIHGTEYPFGLAYIKGCGNTHVIASIQGFRLGISRYALGGIPINVLKKNASLKDIIRTPVWKDSQQMAKGGKIEVEYVGLLRDIIGRTRWDQDHTWAINSKCNYHFCNETLREPFFNCRKWDVDSCQKFRIFLSQAASPIKGIHKLIQALPLVLAHYPATEVYVAGYNFLSTKTLRERLKQNAFSRYIKYLIKRNNISNKIHFLGPLDEEKMIEQLQLANVFICPSSIENSPNSLGEAQLVGTPCVASYVGGVPEMITHGIDGLLYRFEETEMLASCICRIFHNSALAKQLSVAGIERATERHCWKTNALRMMDIYNKIAVR